MHAPDQSQRKRATDQQTFQDNRRKLIRRQRKLRQPRVRNKRTSSKRGVANAPNQTAARANAWQTHGTYAQRDRRENPAKQINARTDLHPTQNVAPRAQQRNATARKRYHCTDRQHPTNGSSEYRAARTKCSVRHTRRSNGKQRATSAANAMQRGNVTYKMQNATCNVNVHVNAKSDRNKRKRV